MMQRSAPFTLMMMFCGGAVFADPLAVQIVTIEPATQTLSYSLTGELRAANSVSVSFPIAGRVIDVLVEEGQSVAQGTVLARIDPVQQQQQLRAAEAGLDTARADERQAKEDLDRADALLERGTMTRAARDAAEDALKIAEGALAQARADLDRAKKALNDTEITAPQDVTVISRAVESGQIVGAAQPVLELALSNGIEAVFDVPESQMAQDVGPATIQIARLADPDVTFVGHISEVSPLVDAGSGTVEVTVAVDDQPPGLTYGEAVRGTATLTVSGQIVLPYSALVALGQGAAVWRVDPVSHAVSLQPIEIARYRTGQIVVSDGVATGDMIVGAGAQLMYPGRVVRAAEGTK